MPGINEADDSPVERVYCSKLIAKIKHYEAMGLNLVIIWADQMGPRMLGEKMNEVLGMLGLPLRAPPPTQWFEETLGGESP